MLLGQYLRRSHKDGLIAVLHCDKHCIDRKYGFSGANIPLNKAIHRCAAVHIVCDLIHNPELRLCGREGKLLQKALLATSYIKRYSVLLFPFGSKELQHQSKP